jgi:peptidoglycan/xylan/chitin deacetylase (PgdA/CDA1 family)
MLTSALRRTLLEVVRLSPTRSVLRPLMKGQVVIMMMHRFADRERGIQGHDTALLRNVLEILRAQNVRLLSMRDLLTATEAGEPIEGFVFTVDDGYDDFETAGAPVFREFDCPVTVFVATGFLDGAYWNWWDKADLVFRHAEEIPPNVLASGNVAVSLSEADRQGSLSKFIHALKNLPEHERHVAVARLARACGVDLPQAAPNDRSPLTWSAVRRLAASGVEFGPHTVTHAYLAPMTTDEIVWELEGSYRRLQQEIENPVPVFCYPYGRREDLSELVTQVSKDLGIRAAVTAVPGYVDTRGLGTLDPFRLPRFAFPSKLIDFHQVVTGFERFKEILRRGLD